MRLSALAALLLGLGGTVISAQSSTTVVTISEGRSRAGLEVAFTAPYQGGPWAAVPASPFRLDSNVTAAGFRIRAWKEGQRARVVVFVIIPEEKGREKETQIATFSIEPGQSVEVTETEQYGATHVTVSAAAR